MPTTISALPHSASRVHGAIAAAARASGIDFNYLLGQARIESGLNPRAQAATSSARGLYQFVEQTWLATVKAHGAAHGLGAAAAAIEQGRDGRFRVADAGARRAVLALRDDPQAAASMAAAHASDNASYLEARIGRRAQPVDLYLAHFLGKAGAARFLASHSATPDAAAASQFPAAARANRGVFFDRSGAPRSFEAIRARFERKLGGSGADAGASSPPPAFTASPVALAATPPATEIDVHKWQESRLMPSPATARLSYLMLLAGDGV